MRSTRLPGKMLADIGGKPLVAWVAERAKASGAKAIYIATDHDDIAKAVSSLGWKALKTSESHETGTDRLAEAAALLDLAADEIVVNVQGDEPLIDPRLIREVAAALAAKPEASIATAAHPIESAATFFDPNVVKVVTDVHGFAQYFSRAPIPFARDAFAKSRDALPAGFPALRHIGIYAYRVSYLRRYAGLARSPLEATEQLEQLRVLWHGGRIAVAVVSGAAAPGVDTPEDLDAVRRMWVEESRRGGASQCV